MRANEGDYLIILGNGILTITDGGWRYSEHDY